VHQSRLNQSKTYTAQSTCRTQPTPTISENLRMQVESATHSAGSGNGGDVRPHAEKLRSDGMLHRGCRAASGASNHSRFVNSYAAPSRCGKRM
jgi:hypothetical protein